MPAFPSLEWCRTLASVLESDPAVAPAVREWKGRTIGVVIGKDRDFPKDFCVFAKPDPAAPKLLVLKECEDEDDLELEEPDYLFRAPFGTVKQLIEKKLDPLDVLRRGQVRVEGDLGFLVPFGQKYQSIGDRALAVVETKFG